MEFFLREIEKALECKLYYLALTSVLTLPDICGALQSDNGQATGARYKEWYKNYVQEPEDCALSAEECYRFRCALVHQGKTHHDKSRFDKIMFLDPDIGLVMHNCIIDGVLDLDIVIFCNLMIAAVRKWETEMKDNLNFAKNYEKLIRVHPDGIPPYIVGAPVIG